MASSSSANKRLRYTFTTDSESDSRMRFGRPVKYSTDEEKRSAKRSHDLKYRHKKRQIQELQVC
ncbi:hypothetical protein BDZ91DRAFT_729129 [Kalaharituber pfeilii]|nr:hypothetical protein BDZ91DRAFT_729127 [Kalaharituber pfeilii]KAF8464902.1 hypothetical protein BDZ91DRAFT_729129 [Kalaharituber pfeilii]